MARCCTSLDSEALLVAAWDGKEGALHQLPVLVGERLLRRAERGHQVRLRVCLLQCSTGAPRPLPRLRDVEQRLLNLAQMALADDRHVRRWIGRAPRAMPHSARVCWCFGTNGSD